MNCEEANQIDLVDYLYSLGYHPQKIRNYDHWYLSPLREEKEASFKVNRQKNLQQLNLGNNQIKEIKGFNQY